MNADEGELLLVEYVEPRPPLLLNPGMASKVLELSRGDSTRRKARCSSAHFEIQIVYLSCSSKVAAVMWDL